MEKHDINITLPDGKVIQGKSLETTPLSIAKSISKNLAKNSVVAKVSYSKKYSNFFEKVIECDPDETDEH